VYSMVHKISKLLDMIALQFHFTSRGTCHQWKNELPLGVQELTVTDNVLCAHTFISL
jgi:hypothetical protein